MRFPRSISMEMATWQFLVDISKKENTSLGRIVETALREKYGNPQTAEAKKAKK